jgi:carbamoyl-phosphate synthase large subunit
MRLLFTGGGGSATEALWRFWQDRYELHFADADEAAICPVIPVGRRHAIPFAVEPGYNDALAALCRRMEIDLLIPGVDEELPHIPAILSAAPDLMALCPDPAYVETMCDKLATARALSKAGLDSPRTETLDDADSMGFPCVLKPRLGRGSRGFHIVLDADQADAYRRLYRLSPLDIVAQELLTGQEYTVTMAADRNGRLRAVVPVKVQIKRGITLRAETEDNPQIIAACEAIHAALPTRGSYNIQLMLTDSGRVVPFEINPRISTTVCLAIAAGVDPVALYLDDAPAIMLHPFTDGVRLRRYWFNAVSAKEGDPTAP